MPLLLQIDTAIETAIVAVSRDGVVINTEVNSSQKEHASFVHPAVKKLLQHSGLQMTDINAVAVTSGPGSYTGLRVGMAAAKGLCYALNIPLITVSTLEVMAKGAIIAVNGSGYYCPMIDARRMEVFTALYDRDLKELIAPCSLILEEEIPFKDLTDGPLYLTGSGTNKLPLQENIIPVPPEVLAKSLAELAFTKFERKDFADVAYSSPAYLKEFYTVPKKGA
jgi:tRNA threonylcarbamoyladenosine biosynthesis protein TsaB